MSVLNGPIAAMRARPLFAPVVLLALLAAVVLANFAFALALHQSGTQTALWDLHFWLIFPGGHVPDWMPVNDSWMPMRKAYAWLAQPHHGLLYQQIFFERHIKFQYPPSSLLVFAVPDALHLPLSDRALNWIGWFAVAVEAAAVGLIAFVAARSSRWARTNPSLHLVCAVAIGLCVFTFHSVLWAFSLGQIQAWVNAGFALAVLAFLTGRQRLAGALIGAICLVKPQFALFLVWAVLRRRWRFAGALVVMAAAGLAVSVARFGIGNHLDYLSAVSFMNQHGEAYYPNVSVNGVLNRLLGNSDPFTVDKHAFPPFNPIVYYASTATSLCLLAIALFLRGKDRGGLADFLVAGIVFTIASPIAWQHHLGILPPAMALLAIALAGRRGAGSAVLAGLLAAAYFCSSIFIPPVASFASGIPSLVYGVTLLGALGCIFLLLRLAGDLPEVRST